MKISSTRIIGVLQYSIVSSSSGHFHISCLSSDWLVLAAVLQVVSNAFWVHYESNDAFYTVGVMDYLNKRISGLKFIQ